MNANQIVHLIVSLTLGINGKEYTEEIKREIVNFCSDHARQIPTNEMLVQLAGRISDLATKKTDKRCENCFEYFQMRSTCDLTDKKVRKDGHCKSYVFNECFKDG
ncbi:hypothetical protein KAR91_53290 [Candidatus Pacearchaeota archaeon]|nr:hypothetical protein [Candidatus Pacearchaeota archaeon]